MINGFKQVLLQSVQTEDFADSIAAFFESNMSVIRSVNDQVSKYLNEEIQASDLKASLLDAGISKVCISIPDQDVSNARFINVSELCTQLEHFLQQSIEEFDAAVATYDYHDEKVGQMMLSDVMARFNDMLTSGESVIATCYSYSEWVTDTARDFYTIIAGKVEGILTTDNPKVSKIKNALANVATTLGDSISVSLPETLSAVLQAIGIPVSPYSTGSTELDTYSDLPAFSCVVNEYFEKLGWAADRIGQVLLTIPAAIVLGLQKLGQGLYHGITAFWNKVFNNLLNTGNSIASCTIPGKGTISHPGFSVLMKNVSNPYTSAVNEACDEFMSNLGLLSSVNQSYTLPIGPMILYLSYTANDGKIRMSYDMCPMQYKQVSSLFKKTFDKDLQLLCKVNQSIVQEDAASPALAYDGLSISSVTQFLSEIAANPGQYYGLDGEMDAEWWMSIQTGRFIAGLYLALGLEDPAATVISYSVASDVANKWLHFNVTQESNYESQYQGIEPSNLNTARLLTFMGYESGSMICFNDNLSNPDSNTIDLSNVQYDDYRYFSGSQLWAMMLTFVNQVVFNAVESTGYYMPYFHRIKYYRPSYYVPTDQQNVATTKRMLTTVFTVAAVAIVVIVAVIIARKAALKIFALQAEAGQASWDAAKVHDTVALKAAFKLQKRANLISKLCGVTTQASANALVSLPSTLNSVASSNSAKDSLEIGIGDVATLIRG